MGGVSPSVSPAGKEPDLRPWASYVLGRNPAALSLGQERDWDHEKERFRAGERHLIPVLIEELEDALRVLGNSGQFDTDVVERLRELLEDFDRKYMGTYQEESVWRRGGWVVETGVIPGQEESAEMSNLSMDLFEDSHEHRLWWGLGKAITQLEWLGSSVSPMGRDTAGLIGGAARALVGFGRYPFLEAAMDLVDRIAAPEEGRGRGSGSGANAGSAEALATLDERVREGLKELTTPELLITLGPSGMVLFGEQMGYKKWRSEIGCLWVLAANVPRSVERVTIREEAKLGTSPQNIANFITKLRKNILRPCFTRYCERTGRTPTAKELEDCFVTCRKDVRGEPPGPYKLDLHPEQVRVVGPKPNWMIPKWGQ